MCETLTSDRSDIYVSVLIPASGCQWNVVFSSVSLVRLGRMIYTGMSQNPFI